MKYIVMMKVDAIQVFINASAVIGISVLWAAFTKKVFETVLFLANDPFYDWSDDDLEEEIPQIPKPMLPHYDDDDDDDGSESFPEITEPPPPYQLNAD